MIYFAFVVGVLLGAIGALQVVAAVVIWPELTGTFWQKLGKFIFGDKSAHK